MFESNCCMENSGGVPLIVGTRNWNAEGKGG